MLPEIIFEILLFSVSVALAVTFNSYYPILAFIFGTALIFSSFLSFLWAPYVPSAKEKVKKMIKLAEINKGMKVYDLGAGNGILINEAAKQGADAIGYEISFPLVAYYFLRRKMGIVKGKLLWGNFFTKDVSDADIIFCYLLPHTMGVFHKKIYPNLKKGTKIIANAFPIKDLEPNKVVDNVYMYIK